MKYLHATSENNGIFNATSEKKKALKKQMMIKWRKRAREKKKAPSGNRQRSFCPMRTTLSWVIGVSRIPKDVFIQMAQIGTP